MQINAHKVQESHHMISLWSDEVNDWHHLIRATKMVNVILPPLLNALLWVGAGILICGLCILCFCLLPLCGKTNVKQALKASSENTAASETTLPPRSRYDCIFLKENERKEKGEAAGSLSRNSRAELRPGLSPTALPPLNSASWVRLLLSSNISLHQRTTAIFGNFRFNFVTKIRNFAPIFKTWNSRIYILHKLLPRIHKI